MVQSGSTQGAKDRRGGPPLALLAAISLALLIAGVVTSAVLGGVFPSPFSDPAVIERYVAGEPDAVVASAVFGLASAVALVLYAAAGAARVRDLAGERSDSTIALAGGTLAGGMLAGSALVQWVLTREPVRADVPLVRALHDLAFLTGGVGHVVFLGVLVAGLAVLGQIPRALAIAGLVIAAVAGLSIVSLVWTGTAVLLPAARFPGLLWLIVTGALLARRGATPVPAATEGVSR
ncbi:MAG: DUF4386 domain-containing protein [Pseudonocardia sp.]|nr:DUF4386 domain-containing protein [Pseudonocardia sp.]